MIGEGSKPQIFEININMEKKYKWLLFDADNTLLDFSGTARKAFDYALKAEGLEPTEEHWNSYHDINERLWGQLEKGTMTKEKIRTERFKQFLEKWALDYDYVKVSKEYLAQLIPQSILFDGAMELLNDLKEHFLLGLVTNGLKEVQRPRLRKVGIYDFFDIIVVSDEIGSFKPNVAYFDYTFSAMAHPPKESVIIIGDNLNSDILGGMNYGIDTCWFNYKNNTNKTAIVPTYEISELKQFLSVVQ